MEQRKNFKDKMKELNLPFASAVYCSRIISQKTITTETYSTEKIGLKVLKKIQLPVLAPQVKSLKVITPVLTTRKWLSELHINDTP